MNWMKRAQLGDILGRALRASVSYTKHTYLHIKCRASAFALNCPNSTSPWALRKDLKAVYIHSNPLLLHFSHSLSHNLLLLCAWRAHLSPCIRDQDPGSALHQTSSVPW